MSSIDVVICAELPNENLFPKLFSTVTNFMMHGPCGVAQRNSPCMKDGKCSKFYPKKFVPQTLFDENGYPVYRRRDYGIFTLKNNVELDNKRVVPYNPKLLMKYQAHVNIDLFKYVNKGIDRVTVSLTIHANGYDVQESADEVKQYYDC